MSEKTKNSLGITLQSAMLGLGLFFLGRLIRNNYYIPFIKSLKLSQVITEAFNYLGHIIFLILLLIYFFLVKEESHYLKKFEFSSQRKDFLWVIIGIISGFLMNGICILPAYLHGDIILETAKYSPKLLMILLLAIIVQSSVEEFQFRLWTHSRILDTADLKYAAIGSALAFSICHMFNSGITLTAFVNITLAGVLYSLVYYYSGSIWLPCTMHAAWNFTQTCIFGLPNSGNPAVESILQPTLSRRSILYDPKFGVEGTIISTIVTLAAILIAIYLGETRKKKTATAENT